MTALTGPRTNLDMERSRVRKVPVGANQTIYHGALVAINATGFLVEATDAAANKFAGILIADYAGSMSAGVLVSPGTDGAVWGIVEDDVVVTMAATSITQDMVGTQMYVVDDQTVDDAPGATSDMTCGTLVEYVSTSSGRVHLVAQGSIGMERLIAVSEDFDLDSASATIDRVILVASVAATILKATVIYTGATTGTVAAANVRLGTAVGGSEIVGSTAYENTKAVGTTTALVLTTPVLAAAAALHIRHTSVAATQAGFAHVQVEYKLDG